MERLRNLAHEALTWPHLNGQHRLMWATVLELDVVPVQDTEVSGAEKDTRMLRFKQSNARKKTARSTSKNVLAWLLLVIGIGGPQYIYLQGLVHPRWCRILSINSIPAQRSCLPGSWSDRTSAEGIQAIGFWESLLVWF